MFKTVLFPIDQSREAQEAAHVVIDIVQKYQSDLVLLSVLEDQEDSTEAIDQIMTSEVAINGILANAQKLFASAGITARLMQKKGKPAFTICDIADEINANLIIMGSRGIGINSDRQEESVTSRVINLSPCPVLVVP